jgi:hypothetical protein
MKSCDQCGHVNPDDARFCGACGTLTLPAEPEGRSSAWWHEEAPAEVRGRADEPNVASPVSGFDERAPARTERHPGVVVESRPVRTSRRNVVALAVIGALIVAGVAVGSIVAAAKTENSVVSETTPTGPGPTTFDDAIGMLAVTGLPIDVARSSLTDAGIGSEQIQVVRKPTTEEPAGAVIEQVPAVNRSVSKDTKVVLTVAAYPARMPDYVGLNVDEASIRLERMGIEPQIVYVIDDIDNPRPSGTVVAQTAPAGAAFAAHPTLSVTATPIVKEMSELGGTDVPYPESVQSGGRNFPNALAWYVYACDGPPEVMSSTFALRQRYRLLRIVPGRSDDTPPGLQVTASLSLDGTPVQSFTFGTAGAPIELDVSGHRALRVDLSITGNDNCPDGTAFFGNARLFSLPGDGRTRTTAP